MRCAFLFPGQGSQYIGMGKDYFEAFALFRQIFEEASDILHWDMKKMCFDTSPEDQKLTQNSQPAIFTCSYGIYKIIKQEVDLEPALVAGHSLGEWTALVAADYFSFQDALKLVSTRGRLMGEAASKVPGGMATALGLPELEVNMICEQIQSQDLFITPANYNSPQQLIVSGENKAIDLFIEKAEKDLGKRAIRLPVSAPFHCRLMRSAADQLRNEMENLVTQPLSFPIIANTDGQIYSQDLYKHANLIDQITLPVLWTQTMEVVNSQEITHVWEVGPGRVLSGLLKKNRIKVPYYYTNQISDFKKCISSVEA